MPDMGPPVRVTQSFVHTLSECWRRPSLTAIEVAWRWLYGVPAMWLLWHEALKIWTAVPVDLVALRRISILDPMSAVDAVASATAVLWSPVLATATWLVPISMAAWVVVSSLGRTAVLKRADARLHARPMTLVGLQVLRTLALASTIAVWAGVLRWASAVAIGRPVAAGEEPNLVLYSALAIVATLGIFTLWALMSWVLSVAPLLAMLHGFGVRASLRAAFQLGSMKAKLVEINLVMGIVKIALIVLAMVFSATPLPFESVATPEFMAWWYLGVTLVYFVASDFFHVARIVGYLELWRGQVPESNVPWSDL